ncbi:hypothetical protein [Curtobacterium sp. VKM Ac-2884]|uniref:hypothetical protein n=1 Tax=Curtobacterium sp. VKM Ac-2884 TaxID=2783818 RepID=UPI00188C4128|nr:hypothetical protein [Curtobacterium sp. VKM Ac-2884]MBF4603766.1 hypothetical protein [Curtobacterium sp. VKM Ac-2884]
MSLFRARWLSTHPQDEQPGKPSLAFFGFSQDSMLLLRIHNFLAGQAAGTDKKVARELALDGPAPEKKARLFAPTIAEFDTDRFMGVIASGKF